MGTRSLVDKVVRRSREGFVIGGLVSQELGWF